MERDFDNEFDSLFREKLSEEAEFPLQEETWEKVMAGLAMPAPVPLVGGGGAVASAAGSNLLRYAAWSAAGLALVVSTWLGYNLNAIKKDNAALTQKVSDLEARLVEQKDTIFQTRTIIQTDTIYRNIYISEKTKGSKAIDNQSFTTKMTPSVNFGLGMSDVGNNKVSESKNEPNTVNSKPKNQNSKQENEPSAVSENKVLGNKKSENATKANLTSDIQNPKSNDPSVNFGLGMSDVGNKEVLENGKTENATKTNLTSDRQNPILTDPSVKVGSEQLAVGNNKVLENKEGQKITDSKQAENKESEKTVALKTEETAVKTVENKVGDTKKAETAKSTNPKSDIQNPKSKDSFDIVSDQIAERKGSKKTIIKTPSNFKMAGLRVGIFGGRPILGGFIPIEHTRTLGLTVESAFGKNWRIGATFDASKVEFKQRDRFDDKPPRSFPLPNAPRLQPNEKFDRIEGDLKSWQIGLNVARVFIADQKIRPFLSAGYAYRHVPTFETKYTISESGSAPKTVSQPSLIAHDHLFQVGFGLEATIYKRFEVRLRADYFNTIADPSKFSDMWLLRGGVLYKF